jgi:rhodanese-related sulfurtransferase
VSWFPNTFPAAPRYFFLLRPVNQAGPRLRSEIAAPALLPPAEFDRLSASATIIDVRPQAEFMAGHIAGAVSIAFRDAFATWLGWLIPEDAQLLFVLGDETLEQVLDECLLVGYERFAGVLAGGMKAWANAGREVASAELVDADGARRLVADGALALDVREPSEFAEGHIPGALHIPLGVLEHRAAAIPTDRPIVTYCGHGERSATAVSVLEKLGFRALANFDGGFGSWQEAGLEVER